jgi:hypothetical protein
MLSPDEMVEAEARHALWNRAAEMASMNPGIDAGDVFHALKCLQLSPSERLRLSFQRGRLRAHAR